MMLKRVCASVLIGNMPARYVFRARCRASAFGDSSEGAGALEMMRLSERPSERVFDKSYDGERAPTAFITSATYDGAIGAMSFRRRVYMLSAIVTTRR